MASYTVPLHCVYMNHWVLNAPHHSGNLAHWGLGLQELTLAYIQHWIYQGKRAKMQMCFSWLVNYHCSSHISSDRNRRSILIESSYTTLRTRSRESIKGHYCMDVVLHSYIDDYLILASCTVSSPYFACYSISHSLYSHSRKLLSYFHAVVLTGLSTLRGSPVQMTGIQVNIQLGW